MDKNTRVYIGMFGSGENSVFRVGEQSPNAFINCYSLDDAKAYAYRREIFGESEVYHSMEEALPAAQKLAFNLRQQNLRRIMDDPWRPEIVCVEFFSPHLNIEDNLNG